LPTTPAACCKRSSTRPYPWDEEEIEGLTVEDIDGDGRILQMRIADPNGLWKDHPEQPGLMIRRDPIETGGRYYRVLPEGTIENWDGVNIPIAPPPQGLDLNRNWPADWAPAASGECCFIIIAGARAIARHRC